MEKRTVKENILEKNESFSSERLDFIPAWNVDLSDLQRNADDLDIANGVGAEFPNPYTIDDAKWFVNHSEQEWEGGEEYSFGMLDKETKEFCGMMGFKVGGSEIENIGYWFGRNSWNKGLASEALRAAIEYIKVKFPDVREVTAVAYKYNKPSQRVLEKNGFEIVGEKSKPELLRNGEKFEEFVYSYKF
jgi:[ribosomal protein S5]-alanine N-acetyltransferase